MSSNEPGPLPREPRETPSALTRAEVDHVLRGLAEAAGVFGMDAAAAEQELNRWEDAEEVLLGGSLGASGVERAVAATRRGVALATWRELRAARRGDGGLVGRSGHLRGAN